MGQIQRDKDKQKTEERRRETCERADIQIGLGEVALSKQETKVRGIGYHKGGIEE